MKGYIYKVTNKVTGKSYIGQTRNSVEFRWRQHKNSKDCYYFHKAIQKYGESNFEVTTLEECNVEDLDSKEIYYISKYNTFEEGYNMTKGGYSYNPTKRYTNGYIVVDSKYDEIKGMYLSGFSATKIAEVFNVDRHVICNILKSMGCKLKNSSININNIELEEIVKDYSTGVSLKSIAKKYNISSVGLKEYLIKKGVNIKNKYSILKDEESQLNMIREYLHEKITLKELLKKYHCEYNTFNKVLSLHNIDKIGKGSKTGKLSDKEVLTAIQLFNKGTKILDIAKLFKVDKCTIYSYFKKYNVNYKTI